MVKKDVTESLKKELKGKDFEKKYNENLSGTYLFFSFEVSPREGIK